MIYGGNIGLQGLQLGWLIVTKQVNPMNNAWLA
jgi:hypothetical protein